MADNDNINSVFTISANTMMNELMTQLDALSHPKRIQVAIALGQVSRFGKHSIEGVVVNCTQQHALKILQEMELADDFSLNLISLYSCYGSKDLDSASKQLSNKSRIIQQQAIKSIPSILNSQLIEGEEAHVAKYFDVIKSCPQPLRLDLVRSIGREEGKGKKKSNIKAGLSIAQRAIDEYIQSLPPEELIHNTAIIVFASQTLLEGNLAEPFIEHSEQNNWKTLIQCRWAAAIDFLSFWAEKVIESKNDNDEKSNQLSRVSYVSRQKPKRGRKKMKINKIKTLNTNQIEISKLTSATILVQYFNLLLPIILQSAPQSTIIEGIKDKQKEQKKKKVSFYGNQGPTILELVKKIIRASGFNQILYGPLVNAYPKIFADFFIQLVQQSQKKNEEEKEKKKKGNEKQKEQGPQKLDEDDFFVQISNQMNKFPPFQQILVSFDDVVQKLDIDQILTMLRLQNYYQQMIPLGRQHHLFQLFNGQYFLNTKINKKTKQQSIINYIQTLPIHQIKIRRRNPQQTQPLIQEDYRWILLVNFLDPNGSWLYRLSKENHEIVVKEIVQLNRESNGYLNDQIIKKLDYKQRAEEARKEIEQLVKEYNDDQKKNIIKQKVDLNEKRESKETTQQSVESSDKQDVVNIELELGKLFYAIYLPWKEFFPIVKNLMNNSDINIRELVVHQLMQYVEVNSSHISLCQVMNIMLQKKKEQNQVRIRFLSEINFLPKKIFLDKKKESKELNKDTIEPGNQKHRSFFEMMDEYIQNALDDTSTDKQSINLIYSFLFKVLTLNQEWSLENINLLINERGIQSIMQGLLVNEEEIENLPNSLKKELCLIFQPTLNELFEQQQDFGNAESYQQWRTILSLFVGIPEINNDLIEKINETLSKAKQTRVAFFAQKLLRQNDKNEKKKLKKQKRKELKSNEIIKDQTPSSTQIQKYSPFSRRLPLLVKQNWGLISIKDILIFIIKHNSDILTPLFQLESQEQKQLIDWAKKAGSWNGDYDEQQLYIRIQEKKQQFLMRQTRIRKKKPIHHKNQSEMKMLIEGPGAGLINLPFKFVQGSKQQQLLYAQSLMQIINNISEDTKQEETQDNENEKEKEQQEENKEEDIQSIKVKKRKLKIQDKKQVTGLQLASFVKRLVLLPAIPSQILIKLATEDKRVIVYESALRVLNRIDSGEGIDILTDLLQNDEEKSKVCIHEIEQIIDSMPPLDALKFLRKIPNKKVTVVKEKVRLILNIKDNNDAVLQELFLILNPQEEELKKEEDDKIAQKGALSRQEQFVVHKDVKIAIVEALCNRFIQYNRTWDYLEKESKSNNEEISLHSLPDIPILISNMEKKVITSSVQSKQQINKKHKYKGKVKVQQSGTEIKKELDEEFEGETVADRVKKILLIQFSHSNEKVVKQAQQTFNAIPLIKFSASINDKEDHKSLIQFIATLLDHENITIIQTVFQKLLNEISGIELKGECRIILLQKLIDISNKKYNTERKQDKNNRMNNSYYYANQGILNKGNPTSAPIIPFLLRIPKSADKNASDDGKNDTELLTKIIREWMNIPGLFLLNSFIQIIKSNIKVKGISELFQINMNQSQFGGRIQRTDAEREALQDRMLSIYNAIIPLLEEKTYTIQKEIELLVLRLDQNNLIQILETLEVKKRFSEEDALFFISQFKQNQQMGLGYAQNIQNNNIDDEKDEDGCGITLIEKKLLSNSNEKIRRIGFEFLVLNVTEITEKGIKEEEDEQQINQPRSQLSQKKGKKYKRFWGVKRRELLRKCREDSSLFVSIPAMLFNVDFDE